MSEEREYILGARIDEPINQNDAFKSADPFNKSWTELKSYSGIDNNFKRSIS